MNRKNFKLVLDLMTRHQARIDMDVVVGRNGASITRADVLLTDCQTVGCICGWTLALFAPDTNVQDATLGKMVAIAAGHLGLDLDEAAHLFMGHWRDDAGLDLGGIEPEDVLARMRELLAEDQIEADQRLRELEPA